MREDAKPSDIKLAMGRAISKTFTKGEWLELALITDTERVIKGHSRLLRSLDFGDDDYLGAVLEVLPQVLGERRAAGGIRFSNLDAVEEFLGLEAWLAKNDVTLHGKLYGPSGTKFAASHSPPSRLKHWGEVAAEVQPHIDRASEKSASKPQPRESGNVKRKVFLVHGRDMKVRAEVVKLLKAFDLSIVTWDKASAATKIATPDTMAIIEAGMDEADATVVLFTPDDVGHVKRVFAHATDPEYETEPTGQARLNVVFEAGMAWSRDRQHVVLVEAGFVRPMSDTVGVNTVRLKNTNDSRKSLRGRLITAGLSIDLEDDEWRDVGDFNPTVQPLRKVRAPK